MITFDELVKIQPKLQLLLDEIKKEPAPKDRMSCWFTRWYGTPDGGGYKSQMMKLVGYFAESDNLVLKTENAYDAAYQTLLYALPGCNECQMFNCLENPLYKLE